MLILGGLRQLSPKDYNVWWTLRRQSGLGRYEERRMAERMMSQRAWMRGGRDAAYAPIDDFVIHRHADRKCRQVLRHYARAYGWKKGGNRLRHLPRYRRI